MIIRPHRASLHLITQPDHAALAGQLMRHWRADELVNGPRRSSILLAIDEHDNGWREVDAVPIVDLATGRILDFITAPDVVRQQVWPRAVGRLASTPYAAALVAHHALHVYRRYRDAAAWASFFPGMEAERETHLSAASGTLDELLQDYRFLRAGDLASLTFCNGWTEVQADETGYAVHLDGERLVVAPDPFDGRQIPIEIAMRELPARAYRSVSEALEAFQNARTATLKGVAVGG